MNIKTILFGVVALASANVAFANDGRQLYVDFGCMHCHGEDAKATGPKGLMPIAGMSVNDLFNKTKKMIASKSHADAMAGCGSQPTDPEINKISAYISSLPK